MISSGDTAWVLACTVLIMCAAVGVALIHAGSARSKHSLHALMIAAGAASAASVAWVLAGFSLAFGDPSWNGIVGSLRNAGLVDIATLAPLADGTVPPIAIALFHLATVALASVIVTGVGVERMKLSAVVVTTLVWTVCVYSTVAHWTSHEDGWLRSWGAADGGSGMLVGVTAGASALALTLVLGKRRPQQDDPAPAHSRMLAALGGCLMWIGWMGLTAGASLEAGGAAASAALATHLSAVGGLAGWSVLEKRLRGAVRPSGALMGLVAGLAAAAPSAALLDPFSALLAGFCASVLVYMAMRPRKRGLLDDAMGSVRVVGIGASTGMVWVGLFGRMVSGDTTVGIGALTGGDASLAGKQIVAVLISGAFAFVGTAIIAGTVRVVMGLRVDPEAEDNGIDRHHHREDAYAVHH